jgi:hypothetical protein
MAASVTLAFAPASMEAIVAPADPTVLPDASSATQVTCTPTAVAFRVLTTVTVGST